MKRAFLIGAGATKAVIPEAPLSKNFLESLKNRKESKKLFEDMKQNFKEILSKQDKFEDVDIEYLMNASEEQGESLKDSLNTCVHNAIYTLLGKLTDNLNSDIKLYLDQGSPFSFRPHP